MTLGPEDLPEDPFGEGGMARPTCPCMGETFHLVLTTNDTAQIRCASCQQLLAEFPQASEMAGRFAMTMPERTTIQPPPEFTHTLQVHVATPACDGRHEPGPCPAGLKAGVAWVGEPPPATSAVQEWARPENLPIRITRDDLLAVYREQHPDACTCPPGRTDLSCNIHGGVFPHPHGTVPVEPVTPGIPPTEAEIRAGREVAANLCTCPEGGRDRNCGIHGPEGTAPALANFSEGICNTYLDGGPYNGQITWIMNGPGVDFTIKGVGVYKPTSEVKDGRVIYRWAG